MLEPGFPCGPVGPVGPVEPFVPFVPFDPAGPCGKVKFQVIVRSVPFTTLQKVTPAVVPVTAVAL